MIGKFRDPTQAEYDWVFLHVKHWPCMGLLGFLGIQTRTFPRWRLSSHPALRPKSSRNRGNRWAVVLFAPSLPSRATAALPLNAMFSGAAINAVENEQFQRRQFQGVGLYTSFCRCVNKLTG
jgi:hypothetical protein